MSVRRGWFAFEAAALELHSPRRHCVWQALYRRGQAHQALGAAAAAVPDLTAALAVSPANEKPAIAEKLVAARRAAGMEDADDVEQIEQVTVAVRLRKEALPSDSA